MGLMDGDSDRGEGDGDFSGLTPQVRVAGRSGDLAPITPKFPRGFDALGLADFDLSEPDHE